MAGILGKRTVFVSALIDFTKKDKLSTQIAFEEPHWLVVGIRVVLGTLNIM